LRDLERNTAERLLNWYDENARKMLWRVPPQHRKRGVRPDPYRVWLSEIMLQQTTVVTVGAYFEKFINLWPDIQSLADAPEDDVLAAWAGLGYYARARNLVKCARHVACEFNGKFPRTCHDLERLPGIGPYTSAAIAAIAFDLPETVVDGNVERVMARYFAITQPLPEAKPTLREAAKSLTPRTRPGDYAQAVMDLGAGVCTPRNPICDQCPLSQSCQALAQGIASDLPARRPKPKKPVRHGIVYVARRADGAILLEKRADKGLLGGMLAFPTSDWGDCPDEAPPLKANWLSLNEQVKHTFTHFHLTLTVEIAVVPNGPKPPRGFFVPAADFSPSTLPTLMRKVHALATRADQLV